MRWIKHNAAHHFFHIEYGHSASFFNTPPFLCIYVCASVYLCWIVQLLAFSLNFNCIFIYLWHGPHQGRALCTHLWGVNHRYTIPPSKNCESSNPGELLVGTLNQGCLDLLLIPTLQPLGFTLMGHSFSSIANQIYGDGKTHLSPMNFSSNGISPPIIKSGKMRLWVQNPIVAWANLPIKK